MNNKKKIILLFVIILLTLVITITLIVNNNGTIRKIFSSLINEDEEELNKKEVVYMINKTDQNTMNVTVIAECSAGINKVITPDNNEIISNKEDKNKIAVDYKINIGQEYVFKIQSKQDSEPEEYRLIANTDDKPVIIQNESATYPIITDYGVTLNKKVTIDYGEETNNFYSLDNGKTWEKYKGEINIHQEGILLAKSVVEEKTIQRISSENITITLASDALGLTAYDGNESTRTGPRSTKYIDVDSTMINKGVSVSITATNQYQYGGRVHFTFVNESGGNINTVTLGGRALGSNAFTIPEGTVRIRIYHDDNGYLNEITPYATPVIIPDKKYPVFTEYGVEYGYNNITINYFNTSVQKLYKINDGEWQNYNDTPIRLELEETIYVKGIDKNGIETPINNYKAVLPDNALETAAYDGNESTKTGARNTRYLNVDSTMVNKGVAVKVIATNQYQYGGNVSFTFVNESGEDISSTTLGGRELDSKAFTIPEGTVQIRIYHNDNGYIGEIRPYNAPEISADKKYPIIKESGVEYGYNNITINYFNTSVQKLYKINDGEWQNYNDTPIRLELEETIYVKGIDKNGIETPINNYKAVLPDGALETAAYDGNESTKTGPRNTRYLKVDSTMVNKGVAVKIIATNQYQYGGNVRFTFVNESGEDISATTLGGRELNSKAFTIPEGTVQIRIYHNDNGYIGEIRPYVE